MFHRVILIDSHSPPSNRLLRFFKYTCSGHDLLDVLLLVVPEAIILLIVGVIILLTLGAVDDEVVDVAGLEAALRVLRVSSPLLPKLVHRPKFSSKQDNLVIRNALILFIRICNKRRQNKLQRM
jgi:hypothetical protein